MPDPGIRGSDSFRGLSATGRTRGVSDSRQTAETPATATESIVRSRTTEERLSDRPANHRSNSDASSNTTRVDTSTLAGIEAASQPTTASGADSPNVAPLAGPAAMAARREFNHAPLRAENAFQAYSELTADSFAGPDDMRLTQLNRATAVSNDELRNTMSSVFTEANIDVGGRAKTPTSTYGKLQETAGTTVGEIKDMSGLRVDIDPVQPQFTDVYDAQARVQNVLGEDLTLKQDYIQNPNRWGYTGRVHSTMTMPNGLTHEIQVGTRDISNFIEMNVTNNSNQSISLHDATGYKGQIYGVDLPENLQTTYTDLMGDIRQANALGDTVQNTPHLQGDINTFRSAVEKALPDRIVAPEPALSTRARLGNAAGQGMGILGIAGGGFQAANGVQTLVAEDGDKIEGAANLGAGTTSIVSGAALMTGRVALGTSTGGAVAVIDGARDIYTGVRDGDVEEAVVGTVKAGAGTAMLAGVATANPILIAGGAAVYTGAVVYESRDAIVSGAKAAGNWVKSWFD